MNKVCIIGCGWLGKDLANHFISSGYKVSGSTTRSSKLLELASINIDGFLLSLFQTKLKTKIELHENHIRSAAVVINIPPGRKSFNKDVYIRDMLALIEALITCGAKHLIFISTTSVFNGHKGTVVETTPTHPTSDSGYAHQFIEQYLMTKYSHMSCILRPSGLVDDNRHPINSLSNRKHIAKGSAPINLVHKTDVIKAIDAIVTQNTCNESFNISATVHPIKREYYTWCAIQANLTVPDFLKDEKNEDSVDNKIIDASYTIKKLGITLAFPDPYMMLAFNQ